MGRIDDKETILKRLETLKAYQQCSIVVDLIYGLPDQTMKIWLEDLEILEASAIDGMDIYQLNVFDNSELNKRIQKGCISPAATTAQEAEMYEAAIDFLNKRPFKRLSVCHWSRNSRERNLYNTMAKQDYPMFPFGCGAGGRIGGYSTMLHRAFMPYEIMAMQGKKPFMFFMKELPTQPIFNTIVSQMDQCHFDLRPLIKMDTRLKELKWLFDLWCDRKLAIYNGVTYKLTTAGEFWQVNMTQTVIECVQTLLTGTQTIIRQNIAAQDQLIYK